MILLDPDLDPDPSPRAKSAKRTAVGPPPSVSRDLRLPSARTVSRFLASAQAAVRLKGQVTVLLTTDAAIRQLNHQFRGKNKPTDVLSFPAEGLGAQVGETGIEQRVGRRQQAQLVARRHVGQP